jgi:hypothetical protein
MPRTKKAPEKPVKPKETTLKNERTKDLRTPFTAIEDVLKRKGSPVDQKRIAYQLMHLVGGENGAAAMIMAEYNATQAGSLARARFFELLLKLINTVQQKEISGDLDLVSEQDIANVLMEQCKQSGVSPLVYPSHVCI